MITFADLNERKNGFFPLFFLLTFLLIVSCERRGAKSNAMSEDQEEEIFMQVYMPGAEGRYDEAISVADSLLANVALSDTLRAYIMMERGTAIFNKGDLEHGLAYADTMVDFGRRARVDQLVVQAEQQKGVCYRRKEMYDSAICCFQRAMDLVVREHDAENEQTLSDYLSVMYNELDRLPESLDYGKRSLRLAEEIGDSTAIVSAAATLGAAMLRAGKISETAELLEGYLPVAMNLSPAYQVKYFTPLVKALIEMDSLSAARKYLESMESAAAFLPEGHQAFTAPLVAKSLLLAKEGRHAERWEVLCRIDSAGIVGKSSDAIAYERAACLADMGHWEDAYTRMKCAYDSLATANRSEVARQLSELSVRYDSLSKDYQIEHLRRRNFGYSLIALGCLVVALISAIIVGRVRGRARKEREREYIRGLEQERTRLARELHDGLASDLTGIRLMMASRSDEENVKALKEVSAKVRDLSHQLMAPEFGAVPLTDIIRRYVDNLSRHYHGVAFSVEVTGSFDYSTLPAEISYEIYRMLQEGLRNVLSHSSPTKVSVVLSGNDRFRIDITNDGVDPSAKTGKDSGIGHRTLSARAEIIGADVSENIDLNNHTFTLSIIQN